MDKIKVGIIGCGIIGSALDKWLSKNNSDVQIFRSDPPLGLNDPLECIEVAFISIHIPTEQDGTQNLTLLKEIIKKLPNIPIFIRTTLLPGTCDKLSNDLQKNIFFMPEFLTERHAYSDFCNEPLICCGAADLFGRLFAGKEIIKMSSLEAELAKYAHNVFLTLKVTFFNGIYELSTQINADYQNVRQGFLASKKITENHTFVPGFDGEFGYGGKCFPKDISAFGSFLTNPQFQKMLTIVQQMNAIYRYSAPNAPSAVPFSNP